MTEKRNCPKDVDVKPEFTGKDTAELCERLYPEIKEKKKQPMNCFKPW